jgi:hypothetical protein
MGSGAHFRAPWDKKVKIITGLVTLLAVVLFVAGAQLAGVAVLVIVLVSAVFAPRGYSVSGDELLVHRLGWATRFPLGPSATAAWLPGATSGSIRTFGNGGLFGFLGKFRNETLGSYRAYVTDGARIVVVRRTDQVTLVVTPDDPERMVRAIEAAVSEHAVSE